MIARLGALITIGLFALGYYPTFARLVSYWLANDTYSFGFFIPPLAMLIAWDRRQDVRAAGLAPSPILGTLVTACGMLLLWAGRVTGTNLVEESSIVVTLAGLTLLLFGWRVLRVMAFPLGYLMAMVPIWEPLLARLHPIFQLYSATLGVSCLRLFGLPVFRDGVFIDLPYVKLQVAEACSGINYLISVVCIGLALGSLFVRRWTRRIGIVLGAVAIALLSNGLRVAMVAAFAYYGVRGENGDIHGPYALARSFLVSGVGFLALFALISRFSDRRDRGASTPDDATTWRPQGPWLTVRPALMAVLVLGALLALISVRQVKDVPLHADLDRAIPDRIGRWEWRPWTTTSAELQQMQFDVRLQRQYVTQDGDRLDLFVGYFKQQRQGRELAGYDLHQALGTSERGVIDVNGTEVNDLLVANGRRTYQVTYWYVVDDVVLARDLHEKLYSAWRALVYRRNSGAIVVVRTPVSDGDAQVARARVRDFVGSMIPLSTQISPGSAARM